jgi:murein DD-endopeptidase MepM/ murein hydrolase activator NlpD
LFDFNYVDVDPTTGFHDWDCSEFVYDGHNGNDMDIRSFGEQIIGVPVFAAQDGIVIDTHDGEFDMNTSWQGQPANYVIIDHGNGRETWYFHLKMNSVIVSPSQPVFAGQQIGMCASSGVSTGPHLHFEIHDDCPNTCAVFEPFAGDCRSGESGWVEQPPLDRSAYLHDFGVTHESINAAGPWPFTWPRTGQLALSDPNVKVWWYGTALPANSVWRVTFVRPDGTIALQANPQGFGNPFWRWYNWWWTYTVPDMHSITGTWKVRLFINTIQVIEAPIEVVAVATRASIACPSRSPSILIRPILRSAKCSLAW